MQGVPPQQRKTRTKYARYLRLVFVFSALACIGFFAPGAKSVENDKNVFYAGISAIAEEYVGMPYRYGGDPDKDDMTDNSHLFSTIYRKATKEAGLGYKGYMTIADLLKNTREVNIRNLKNGDLIVIRGRDSLHAGMIFNHQGPRSYRVIYASEKRREVASFDCNDQNFRKYWFDNIKGFFRLNEDMFKPAG